MSTSFGPAMQDLSGAPAQTSIGIVFAVLETLLLHFSLDQDIPQTTN
jgi:hypothetical protein